MSNKAKTATPKPDGKSALTPKLRFPEFRDAEGWPQQQLGSVATFFKGKGLPKSALTPGGKRPCIHYGELFTVYPEVIGAVKSRTSLEEDVFLSVENDVLMPTSDVTPSGLAKACCLNFENVILGGDILVIRTDRHSINGEFLARYIRHLERKVLQLVSGSTVFHLYASSMEKLALSFPTERAEQQKIAECLSSVDELIVAQARKLDALKIHKKGLVQQLFPREGETQPRLRFPEFQNAGEWEAAILGKLIELQSGFAFSSDYFGSGGKKLVTPKNFTKSGVGNFDGTNSKYTTEEVAPKFICSPGDLLLLLTDLTPTCELLGKPLEVAENDGVVLLNQRVAKVKPISNGVTKPFLKQFFLTDTYNAVIVKTASGSTVKHSSNKIIMNMGVVLPSPEEQQRIADCLTSLDDLIAAQTQKLAVLKTHKKGLMQQLFPSPEEVEE